MSSIYLHIPFCRRLCGYCDFFKSVKSEKMSDVVAMMMRELEEERNFLSDKELKTIYFGGGTPSLLAPKHVAAFLERIDSLYNIGKVEEITLEANPDDLTRDYLRELRATGVNRLSIGVQSFDDGALKFMNRRHSAVQAVQAVRDARAEGFDNIAIDLIFGVDGFGGEILQRSLDEAIALDVEHIAAYHLTIEPGTLFARRVARGEFSPVAEEVSEMEYALVHDKLTEAGYEHYEISNYARRGARSKHNSAYWSGSEYLGIGAGAHSFGRGVRRWACDSIDGYLTLGRDGRYESEVLSREERRNEVVMTSLRRCEGLDVEAFRLEYGEDELARLLKDSEISLKSGDLILSDGRLFIPAQRFLRSDLVIEHLFRVDSI